MRVWQSLGDPPVSLLSPSPPQKYLGPGEDGPEEVDDPKLELIGELPAGLEALCKDKGRWGRLGQVAKKKGKNSLFHPSHPKTRPGICGTGPCWGKTGTNTSDLGSFGCVGGVFCSKTPGFCVKIELGGDSQPARVTACREF